MNATQDCTPLLQRMAWGATIVGAPVGIGLFVIAALNYLGGISRESSEVTAQEASQKQQISALKPSLDLSRVRWTEGRTLCRAFPADHATFEFQIRNDREQTVIFESLWFNPSKRWQVSTKPHLREQSRHDCQNLQRAQFKIDLEQVRLGVPLKTELHLAVPPGETRAFIVTFWMSGVEDSQQSTVGLEGVLSVRGEDVEIPILIQPFGDHVSGVMRMPDWGEGFWNNY